MKTLVRPAIWALAVAFAVFSGAPAMAEDLTVGQLFIKAFDKKDEKGMKEIIKTRAAEVPGEVKEMVEYAMSDDAGPEARDFIMNIAGMMSKIYADQTGDDRLLNAVRTNYEKLKAGAKPQAPVVDSGAVEQAKKEVATLSGDQWKILMVRLDEEGSLLVDIDVKESTDGELTPKIDFKKSQAAKELIKKKFPAFSKGKISWSSMGVGLKTLFLDQ